MANKHKEQNGSGTPESGPVRWFYWGMGAVALAGVLLLIFALRSSPEEAEVRPVAQAATPAQRSAAPASAAIQDPQFPAQYDVRGVSIGPEDAPVVVREFADYQCPACGAFAPTAKRIRQEYVATGKVRFVLFDIPLTNVHQNALVAAQAARCAGEQGRYWEMHDALFENQDAWSPAADPLGLFSDYAREIGINAVELRRCVESGATRAAVQRSYEFAIGIGVRSTPTIVVGNVPLAGAQPYTRVRRLIEQQLAETRAP
jgi:protein-disulfide isomerase